MRARKYPNRRLYDLDASCYITRDKLAAAIISGDTVTVERDGQDITRVVLLDIWRQQQLGEGVSAEQLHEMIRGFTVLPDSAPSAQEKP